MMSPGLVAYVKMFPIKAGRSCSMVCMMMSYIFSWPLVTKSFDLQVAFPTSCFILVCCHPHLPHEYKLRFPSASGRLVVICECNGIFYLSVSQ